MGLYRCALPPATAQEAMQAAAATCAVITTCAIVKLLLSNVGTGYMRSVQPGLSRSCYDCAHVPMAEFDDAVIVCSVLVAKQLHSAQSLFRRKFSSTVVI